MTRRTATICPACTLPIPDDERVTVQFEGAPDEVWHRDCLERERSEAHGTTSTAFGLGQFLNSTWATVGGRKTSDPRQQLDAMMRYIAQRYGNPSDALAFHNGAPKVMGLGEIAEAFGVTLRTASRWADRPDFPSPLPGSVSGRPAWDRETVMAWEPPDPRGGRPPR